jgi:hypothetical protein
MHIRFADTLTACLHSALTLKFTHPHLYKFIGKYETAARTCQEQGDLVDADHLK